MTELKENGESEEAGRLERRRSEKGRERREEATRRREATKGLRARPETTQWDTTGSRARREVGGRMSGRSRGWRRNRALEAAHAGRGGEGGGGAMHMGQWHRVGLAVRQSLALRGRLVVPARTRCRGRTRLWRPAEGGGGGTNTRGRAGQQQSSRAGSKFASGGGAGMDYSHGLLDGARASLWAWQFHKI
jgi:hypothetical protein